MRNINILLAFSLLFILSCSQEAEYNVKNDIIYLKKNNYRVKTIKGVNDHWGDFTLLLNYKNDKLINSYRINAFGDTLGMIKESHTSTSYTYDWIDYVNGIDSDSITRLNAILMEKYGEGNYSLKDSIPKVSRTFESYAWNYTEGGFLSRDVVRRYDYILDFGIGDEFDNTYKSKDVHTMTFEYDDLGKLINKRYFKDEIDPDNLSTTKRTLWKESFEYDRDKLIRCVLSCAKDGQSFTESKVYNLEYVDNNLVKIISDDGVKEFIYQDNRIIKIISNDETILYTYDANGNMKTRSINGEVVSFTYEEGHGNFQDFMSASIGRLGELRIK